MAVNFHEDLGRSAPVRGSSDRSFGLVFALVLTVAGLLPLRTHGRVRLPALVLAGIFLLAAAARPAWLHPLNLVWSKLGLLLGRIVNPAVSAILFYLVFTPAGLLARLAGKDPLRLKPAPQADSYWIVRDPPGPAPDTMGKQF